MENRPRTRSLLRGIIISAIVVLTLVNITGFWFWYSMYQIHQEKKQIPAFLCQIIDSVRNSTNFYETHSTQSAMRDYEKIKGSIPKMAGPKNIIFIDYDWDMYEYKILFLENDATFKADIKFHDGIPVLHHLIPVR